VKGKADGKVLSANHFPIGRFLMDIQPRFFRKGIFVFSCRAVFQRGKGGVEFLNCDFFVVGKSGGGGLTGSSERARWNPKGWTLFLDSPQVEGQKGKADGKKIKKPEG